MKIFGYITKQIMMQMRKKKQRETVAGMRDFMCSFTLRAANNQPLPLSQDDGRS